METKQCAVCGSEMKLIPAGVSKKTGKPYSAFMACPNKCQQPKKSSADTQLIIDILMGLDRKIDRIHERFDGLAKYLNEKFQ
jgi:hypothetical protein